MLASATVSPKGMPPPKGRVALVLSPLPLSPRPERALGLLGGTTPHPRSHPRRSSVTPTTVARLRHPYDPRVQRVRLNEVFTPLACNPEWAALQRWSIKLGFKRVLRPYL